MSHSPKLRLNQQCLIPSPHQRRAVGPFRAFVLTSKPSGVHTNPSIRPAGDPVTPCLEGKFHSLPSKLSPSQSPAGVRPSAPERGAQGSMQLVLPWATGPALSQRRGRCEGTDGQACEKDESHRILCPDSAAAMSLPLSVSMFQTHPHSTGSLPGIQPARPGENAARNMSAAGNTGLPKAHAKG